MPRNGRGDLGGSLTPISLFSVVSNMSVFDIHFVCFESFLMPRSVGCDLGGALTPISIFVRSIKYDSFCY